MEIRESTPKGAITGGKAESGGGGSEGKRIYCLIIMRGFDKNRLRRPLKTSSSFAFVPVARIHFFLGFETDFVVTFHSDRTSAAAINTEMEMSSARATLLCFSISNNRNALCVRERGSATETGARLRGSPAGCFAIHAPTHYGEFNWIGFGAAKTAGRRTRLLKCVPRCSFSLFASL